MTDVTIPLPLPFQVEIPVEQLQADIAAGLQDAGGLVANIPAGDVLVIASDVIAVEAAAAALFNSSDATVASPALDAFYNAAAIGLTIQQPAAGQKLILINPNLFRLAGQYLGDFSRWQEIATASGLTPPDPQPIGQFTIVIPQ